MRWRSRTFTGAGFAAVAAVGSLTLSGCSGGGDGQGKEPTRSATASADQPSATSSPTGTATGTASPTKGGGAAQGVGGVWLAVRGGTKVQLVLGKGKAGLTSTSLCAGTYTEHNGIDLVLTCVGGDKDRTAGHGDLSSDGRTLTVKWSGGLSDTFTRTGLPGD
ncbi:hypothetical protein [Streptomyces sp. HPF1205]|uniref:hypothetical protein n=1 Tax=Streptomyces sp. HPF1205 TaxID=2873262 RepID=UPI001CED1879|nr:hypothetical protein [Streptomyces sp. HPF1205]